MLRLYLDFIRSKAGDRPSRGVIGDAIAYVKENYNRPFTTEEIAGAVRLSPSHLRARFKSEVGVSITEYRSRLRIEAARAMLTEGDKSVKEIADLLGYSDLFHFSKAFKEAVGITPARYARLNSDPAEII